MLRQKFSKVRSTETLVFVFAKLTCTKLICTNRTHVALLQTTKILCHTCHSRASEGSTIAKSYARMSCRRGFQKLFSTNVQFFYGSENIVMVQTPSRLQNWVSGPTPVKFVSRRSRRKQTRCDSTLL